MRKLITTTIALIFLSLCGACTNQNQNMPLPKETPQEVYAIDSLPGCDNCTSQLDPNMLNQLVIRIGMGKFGKIHSLIIIHNDKLVLEKYFMGWTRHMLNPIASSTKSFSSSLIGIALAQNKIKSLDEKLLSFFPEYPDIENPDTRKEKITLENLLTMTAGFTWDELSTPYTFNNGEFNPDNGAIKLRLSDDWIKYMLDLPMSDEPGAKFVYNSGCSVLLSGILQNKTGQTAEDFAAKNLFRYIGITKWEWEKGPHNITHTGGGLSLHPINMAMLGYLYLKNGFFNNEQVVPSQWVKESTAPHVSVNENANYGYQWWMLTDTTVEKYLVVNDLFYAQGYGDQFIFVIPHLNLVVVTTAENYNMDTERSPFRMLFGYIAPAVKQID